MNQDKKENTSIISGQPQKPLKNTVVLIVKNIPKKGKPNSKSPQKKLVKKVGIDINLLRQKSQETFNYNDFQVDEEDVGKKKNKSLKKKKLFEYLQTDLIQQSKFTLQVNDKNPGGIITHHEKSLTPNQIKQKSPTNNTIQNNGISKIVQISKGFQTTIKDSSSQNSRRNTMNQGLFKVNIYPELKERLQTEQVSNQYFNQLNKQEVNYIINILLKNSTNQEANYFKINLQQQKKDFQMFQKINSVQQFFNTSYERFQQSISPANQQNIEKLKTSPIVNNMNFNRSNNSSVTTLSNMNQNQNIQNNNQNQNVQQQQQIIPPPIKLRYFNLDNLLKNNINYYFDFDIMKKKIKIKKQQNYKKLRKLIKKLDKQNDQIFRPKRNSIQISIDTLGNVDNSPNFSFDLKNKTMNIVGQKQNHNQQERKQLINEDQIQQLQNNQPEQLIQAQKQSYQQQGQVIKDRQNRYEQKLSKFQMKNLYKLSQDDEEKKGNENQEDNNEGELNDDEEDHDSKQKNLEINYNKIQIVPIQQVSSAEVNGQNQNYHKFQNYIQKFPNKNIVQQNIEQQKLLNQNEQIISQPPKGEENKQNQLKIIKLGENGSNKIKISGSRSYSPKQKRQKSPLNPIKDHLNQEINSLNQIKEENNKNSQQVKTLTHNTNTNTISQNNLHLIGNRKNSLKRKKQSFSQENNIESIQLQRCYISQRNGLGQPKQYLAIFHFDGVLGRYDRPFFQKGDLYYDEDQQCYNQSYSKAMTIHEIMLKYFWQRENLKVMFKSISQFYQVVVIFPEKNEIWEYIHNFFMHNKYNVDGIYYMQNFNHQQSSTSQLTQQPQSQQNIYQETQKASDNQQNQKLKEKQVNLTLFYIFSNIFKIYQTLLFHIKNEEKTKLLVDYNTILNDFDFINPKKILIFNSLDISSDEHFFTIKTPLQLMKEQFQQSQVNEHKKQEEDTKGIKCRSAEQHQHLDNYYVNTNHQNKVEQNNSHQQQLQKKKSNTNLFPTILQRKQTINCNNKQSINDKIHNFQNKTLILQNNEEDLSQSTSLSSPLLSNNNSILIQNLQNNNFLNFPMLKQLIIDNPDYGKLFLGKFAKININKEYLNFILVPSMYHKDRNNKYASGTNCKILTEICIEFMSDVGQKNYLQKNRTQWGIVNLKQVIYDSFKKRRKQQIEKQLNEKQLSTCQEQKQMQQYTQQKNIKWDEDDIISRLDFFFKERIFTIQSQYPNKINLEDLNFEELSLNIEDICIRNNKILKSLNGQTKLRKNQQYIEEDLGILKERMKKKSKKSDFLISSNQLKDVKVSTKYFDSFFICFESFKTFLLQIFCYMFIL